MAISMRKIFGLENITGVVKKTNSYMDIWVGIEQCLIFEVKFSVMLIIC